MLHAFLKLADTVETKKGGFETFVLGHALIAFNVNILFAFL